MRQKLLTLLMIFSLSLSFSVIGDEEFWEYTFRPGDSLWSIAEQYTTSANNWSEIQKVNRIHNNLNRNIQPGTRILIPISLLKNKPVPARVIAINGHVFAIKADGEKVTLVKGSLLYSGDKVVTLNNQYLVMQFADKSQLQVLSDSEVVLDKLSHHKKTGMVDTLIRLNSGRVNTQVKKHNKKSRYEIKTPSAITAVRGTSFRISTENPAITFTEVTEGIVSVAVGGSEKQVNAGFGIIAEQGKPLEEPIKLLEPPEIRVKQTSDKTQFLISWLALSGAKHYSYQLASDRQFNNISVSDITQFSSIKISALKAGRYYFRLRGIDKYNLQGLNAIQEIIVPDVIDTANEANEIQSNEEGLTAPIFLINW